MTSDQVQESATEHATVDYARARKGLEESPTHCTTAEGELRQDSGGLIDFFSGLPSFPSSSSCPDLAMEAVNEQSSCPELYACPELSACPKMTTDVGSLSAAL